MRYEKFYPQKLLGGGLHFGATTVSVPQTEFYVESSGADFTDLVDDTTAIKNATNAAKSAWPFAGRWLFYRQAWGMSAMTCRSTRI